MDMALARIQGEGLKFIRTAGPLLQEARELLPATKEYGEWLRGHFSWTASYAGKLIESYKTLAAIELTGTKNKICPGQIRPEVNVGQHSYHLPKNEGQLRELTKISDDPKERAKAWHKINSDLPRDKYGEVKSAKAVRDALIEHELIEAPEQKLKAKTDSVSVLDSDNADPGVHSAVKKIEASVEAIRSALETLPGDQLDELLRSMGYTKRARKRV
jgi:hypothetical protein